MTTAEPHIAILMATFNGARFIEEQLDSIASQTHRNWSLWISDDGSKDDTLTRIEAWKAKHPHRAVHVRQGPGKGAAQNFISLLQSPEIKSDFFSFSDQDDVWFSTKLEHALRHISGEDGPALYGARTTVTDATLREIGPSLLHGTEISFANALVQNFAAGNTMVFNRAARELVPASAAMQNVVAADWLMYILVEGAGGCVRFDLEPCLFYRQHGRNEIGYNSTILAKLRRVGAVVSGKFSEWSEANMAVLTEAELNPENCKILAAFHQARGSRGQRAVSLLKQAGLRREGKLPTRALYLAAFLGKL